MKNSTNKSYMIKTSQKGFTLIELMIALVLGAIIIGAIYSTYIVQQRSYTVQETVAEMQQNIRAAMMVMALDIRMTGYDPKETGNFSITTASPNKFVFSADLDNSGGSPGAGETLTYELYTPGGQTFTALRRIAGQAAIAENIQAIEFQYLDAAGTPLNFTGIPPEVLNPNNNIRAVQVSILARASRRDRRFTNTMTYCPASNPFVSGTGTCTNGAGTGWGPYNDNFRRRLLITTFQCRNMGL